MVKINDVKVLILSTFDGVELMTGKYAIVLGEGNIK